MNVSHLYILSFPINDGPGQDEILEQSAQGLFHKYAVFRNCKITWYEFRGFGAGTLKLAWDPDNYETNIESNIAIDMRKPQSSSTYIESKEVKWVKKTTEHKQTQKIEYKAHTKEHNNGAIIVAHGSSGSIAEKTPESFAEHLAHITSENDPSDEKILPKFDKIVFNVCKQAETSINEKALPAPWETIRQFDTDSLEKWRAQQQQQKRKPDHIPYNEFYPPQKTKVKFDVAALNTETNEIYSAKDFTSLVRFAYAYAKLCGSRNVLVAGYEKFVTAAHPEKLKPRPLPINRYGSKTNSAGQFDIVSREKKYYSVTVTPTGQLTTAINQAGWTDK